MEDIPGAAQGDQIAACGPGVAAAVLEEMAGLHAPCWEAPELERLRWLNRSTSESDAFLVALVSSLLPGFLERYADTLAPEHQAVCRLFVEHLPEHLRLRSGPRTATHGDFRLDNLLFQPGAPRPVVVDWQTAAWAGASIDVAYFIGGWLSAEDRRAHEPAPPAGYPDPPWRPAPTPWVGAAWPATRWRTCAPTPDATPSPASSWRSLRPWSSSARSG